jgi:nicotinate-nucleotide adenylyltransferase|tara:strand:+ start:19330 stop:19989 length:660 start_codon:yes stop_codon:yes gene_type:complete
MQIVVFGGTFDPVHRAHLKIIEAIQRHISPDRLLVIPCGEPPHRNAPLVNGEHRIEMLRLACKDMEGVVVDDREVRSDELSYSYLTLKSLRMEYPDAVIYMALGWDSLASFTTWKWWQEILEIASILVVQRAKGLQEIPAEIGLSLESLESAMPAAAEANTGAAAHTHKYKGSIVELPFDQVNCSSTEVREILKSGASADAVLALQIQEYIKKFNLYQS